MTVGQRLAMRLKAARKELGISQFELGVKAGIDEATAKSRVSHYELAISVPSLPTLHKLADALEKPLAWFFCEEEEQGLLVALYGLSKAERTKLLTEWLEILNSDLQNRARNEFIPAP